MALDIEHLRSWIGRTEVRVDVATAVPAKALSATLDRDDAPAQPGDPLPPCWHWLYFLPLARQSEIGADGHPQRGGFLPPVPLPRRMWAGSRIDFHAPLRLGQSLQRSSRIEDVRLKEGRSGPLVFVNVRHEIMRRRSIGRRRSARHRLPRQPEAGRPGAACVRPRPPTLQWTRTIVPDDVLLFRYSALTFNGHRIHYDRRYVTEVEGYPGLVVHGPLIATLLLDLLRRNLPDATGGALRLPGGEAHLRHRALPGLRPPQRGRQNGPALGRNTPTARSRWTRPPPWPERPTTKETSPC